MQDPQPETGRQVLGSTSRVWQSYVKEFQRGTNTRTAPMDVVNINCEERDTVFDYSAIGEEGRNHDVAMISGGKGSRFPRLLQPLLEIPLKRPVSQRHQRQGQTDMAKKQRETGDTTRTTCGVSHTHRYGETLDQGSREGRVFTLGQKMVVSLIQLFPGDNSKTSPPLVSHRIGAKSRDVNMTNPAIPLVLAHPPISTRSAFEFPLKTNGDDAEVDR